MSVPSLRPLPTILTLLAITTLGGCATEDFVRKQIGAVDSKVASSQEQLAAQQGLLAAHNGKLDQLDRNTREALERAQAAGKLAEGKFLYSVMLSDDSVKFPSDGSELSEEAKTRLSAFAQKLKADDRNVYLEIQGHTDATGAKAINQRLGAERAETVRRYLNAQGVALNRMATISYGGDLPAATNKTKAGRAQNRRVVIIVLS